MKLLSEYWDVYELTIGVLGCIKNNLLFTNYYRDVMVM